MTYEKSPLAFTIILSLIHYVGGEMSDFSLDELSQSIPEETFIYEKSPRKDKIIAATQYTSLEDERVNVAIIQTKEGDFRIGVAKDPEGLKRGKYIKWIKPEEGPYFVREGYLKGKLSNLSRLFRRRKKEKNKKVF